MKAGEIRRMGCSNPLSTTAREVISTRLGEVIERRGAVTSGEETDALHDLRIAAKRLRYSLEMFALCFPPKAAQDFANRIRELQDILGRIHDLDVLMELLREELQSLDDRAREDVVRQLRSSEVGPERDALLRMVLRKDARRGARSGLYRVIAARYDERARCYEQFVGFWSTLEQEGILARIRTMISIPETDTNLG